jgi:hypothetical protein
MNIWKISTITLTVAMAVVVGRDAVIRNARAAASPDGTTQAIADKWDWGAEQPHMERALNDLKGARHSLEVAAEHKGGWRVLALKHTDEAIAETVRGIEYGKNHPRE